MSGIWRSPKLKPKAATRSGQADDEGKNVGMGAALCSQSAPHKT